MEGAALCIEYERDEYSMTELCGQFGIARETGYVWLRRYRRYGTQGLAELTGRRVFIPTRRLPVSKLRCCLRQAHMTGPRKLKRILERDQPGRAWPATSTVGELVKRAGLVVARKKRRRTEPIRNLWPMRWSPTGCGAPTSRAGFAAAMERVSIR